MAEQTMENPPKSQIVITLAGPDSVAIQDIVMQGVTPMQVIAVASILELYAKSELAEQRAAKMEAIHKQEELNRVSQAKIELAKP